MRPRTLILLLLVQCVHGEPAEAGLQVFDLGFWFQVQGLGFRIEGLGFRVKGGFNKGLGFRV